MSAAAEWLMENRDKIEKGVEILGKGCEILAATIGEFNPILEAVFNVSAELLSNPEGKEARYLSEQFGKVYQNMGKIQDDLKKTERAMQRSSLNIQNFKFYNQIINQHEMFKYIFTAKPKFKKIKVEEFLVHFEEYEGEKNLECLYDAITDKNNSGQTMLDTILATEQRSRRAVEEFCTSLKKVLMFGIISLMGYAALTEGTVEEEIRQKWLERMEDVEKRMKAAVDECVNNFAEQAKIDLEQKIQEKESSVDPEFAKFLLDALVQKYYWVSWSVRVFKNDEIKFLRFVFGKQCHLNDGGADYFEFCSNKIMIVVSFTADPKPLDNNQIMAQIEKEKGGMEAVAESLSNSYPDCLVHALSPSKKVEEANNFTPENFYFISHKVAQICIHSK